MKRGLPIILAAILAASGSCRRGERPVRPAADAPAVDLSAFKPKFEFRGRIAFQSDLDGDNDIYVLTKDGLARLTDDPGSDEFPKWSPDGRRLAFSSNRSGRFQIYVMDADGSNLAQVTHSEADAVEQAWFPDGRRIAYTEQRKRTLGRSFRMWSVELDSGRTERLIPEFDGSNALPEFSPTGLLLGFTGKRSIGWDVHVLDMRTRQVRALASGGKSCRPHFSPDGALIAYVTSHEDGKGDIWTMTPEGGSREKLAGGPQSYDYFPSWSPDGKYVVYSSGTRHYPTEGIWSLALVKAGTKREIPLFASGARDVFPDWR